MNAPSRIAVREMPFAHRESRDYLDDAQRSAPGTADIADSADAPTIGIIRGLLYALPASLLLWTGLAYALRSLF